MKTNEIIKCACGCGNDFEKFDNRGRPRKFISGHQGKNQKHKRLGENVTCEECGNSFYRPLWHIKRVNHHFCSRKCEGAFASKSGRRSGESNGHYNTITVDCAGGCGGTVSKAASLINRRSGNVYCDNCKSLTKKGKKGFYVGYPQEFNNSLRRKIRQRDNYTCQECGITKPALNHTLHIHHIDYDKTNNRESNLISLCRKCHGATNFGSDSWEKKYKTIISRLEA